MGSRLQGSGVDLGRNAPVLQCPPWQDLAFSWWTISARSRVDAEDEIELSGRPYDITVVASAEEALLELDRGPIDMVVTDLRLPGMTGLELLARIRQTNPNLRADPTHRAADAGGRAQAEAPGVVAFLPKPVGTVLSWQAVDRAWLREVKPPSRVDREKAVGEQAHDDARELGACVSFLVHRRGEYVMRVAESSTVSWTRSMGR